MTEKIMNSKTPQEILNMDDKAPLPKWNRVEEKPPFFEHQVTFLVLVNGFLAFCDYFKDDGSLLILTDNRFIYRENIGWDSDYRYAKPTHWMRLPTLPTE